MMVFAHANCIVLCQNTIKLNHINHINHLHFLPQFQVIDLLNPGPKRVNLTVRWNKKSRAFVVDNLFAIECAELEDLVGVLEEGEICKFLSGFN